MLYMKDKIDLHFVNIIQELTFKKDGKKRNINNVVTDCTFCTLFIIVFKKGHGDFLKMSIYHRVTIFT